MRILNFFSFEKIILLLYVFFCFQPLLAQKKAINLKAERNQVQVLTNNYESTKFYYTIEGLNFVNVETKEGAYTELILSEGYSVGKLGSPKLPASKKLIEIPFGADINVKVNDYTTEEYKLSDFEIKNPLMPVQPSLRKDHNIEDKPFKLKPEYYNKKSYIEPELANVEILGVMRGMRIGRLTVAPVQYNPNSGTIKVYNNLEVEVQYSGADKALTDYIKASTYSPYFDGIYKQVSNPFELKDVIDDYPDLTKYPIKMVIVSHPAFEETLQPFIQWKTKQGFEIIEAYTDVIGDSPSEIQSFIHKQYNNGTPDDPAPTFVVLAGDNDKLPASAIGSESGEVTDLYYASVDGDYFPDMYIGRLSARNEQELQNQIDKILYYQQYKFEDPSYLNDATLIAGKDDYWNPRIGQPTVKYGTENYYNSVYGFSNVNACLDSYQGCYDEDKISVSIINYTAHCNQTRWGDPTLGVDDIHNLTNTGQYPLAVGNCCMSAQFSVSESIGEAWVRAENKGAIAYIGSAPNTHWFEDFYWSVGAFPIEGNNDGYVPTTEETTLGAYDAQFTSDYHSVAATKFVGNLSITEAHLQGYNTHSNVQWYWEGYHTFGDPSTIIYITEGKDNDVNHMSEIIMDENTFTIEALPGSYAAISKDEVLHGAAFVDDSGVIDVPIDPIMDEGEVTIVVTKPQHIPYIEKIPATTHDEPFIVLDNFSINDQNDTGKANYGELFTTDITLKNIGTELANQVTAYLSGEDEYITIENSEEPIYFGNIDFEPDNNTTTVEEAFSFEVENNVPDQHQANFELFITDEENEWISDFQITANAPVFSINKYPLIEINDNVNNRLEPGDEGTMTFEVTNKGHAKAKQPDLKISGNSPYFDIDNTHKLLDPIEPGETIDAVFNFSVHSSTPDGTIVNLKILLEDGHFYETHIEIVIGQEPETVIGEETEIAEKYPFYNYYKSNRSQMLYHNDEVGNEEKIITQLGMDIRHITSTSEHQILPNFKVMIKHTEKDSLKTEYVNMEDATIVFEEDNYQMPTEIGWHLWDIKDFEYDGNRNLIVEIIWGMMDDWCNYDDHYRVHGTTMKNKRVVYGCCDDTTNPEYCDNSNILPNLRMKFKTEQTLDTKNVAFTVKNKNNETLLENAAIQIGFLTKYTNERGIAKFDLVAGEYIFSVKKDIFVGYTSEFEIDNQDKEIIVKLNPEKTIVENIEDTYGLKVYPNPTHDIINVKIQTDAQEAVAKILNYQGQIIENKILNNPGEDSKIRFNMGNYAPGIYYLRINTKDDVYIKKIVVQ